MLWLRLFDQLIFNKKINYDYLSEKDKSFIEVENLRGSTVPKFKVNIFLFSLHSSHSFKVLILHGPTGVGKSVLANVAAKLAGYEPFIINLRHPFL